jgi:hypothetical protein
LQQSYEGKPNEYEEGAHHFVSFLKPSEYFIQSACEWIVLEKSKHHQRYSWQCTLIDGANQITEDDSRVNLFDFEWSNLGNGAYQGGNGNGKSMLICLWPGSMDKPSIMSQRRLLLRNEVRNI